MASLCSVDGCGLIWSAKWFSSRKGVDVKSNGIDVHDGWHLTPEGAAIHLAEKTAVVADLHLGYEWARARPATV